MRLSAVISVEGGKYATDAQFLEALDLHLIVVRGQMLGRWLEGPNKANTMPDAWHLLEAEVK